MEKTNVGRLLDASNIKYEIITYDSSITDGCLVAQSIGENKEQVFKTLVTVSNTKEHFVFCVPVNCSLNLKKAAKAVNVKSIEMIKQKELLPLTGYIHGGCSPIGMKKKFVTVIDETAILFDEIFVSAGKVGYQLKINPVVLKEYVDAKFVDICD